MATALRRPVGHEDRLSLVEHLDELRSRLVICVIALLVVFSGCFAFNGTLLETINEPLDRETQKNIEKGRGPLGATSLTQRALRAVAVEDAAALRALSQETQLSEGTRAELRRRADRVDKALARLPTKIEGNKPVTLGVGEPFSTTLTVSAYFAILICLPFLLYQAYAFVLPAFSPAERRVAIPLLAMIPVLFITGVVFGYFLVLPAAVRFLQNFNADEFNVLVQAKDYYKFAAFTLGALGLVFQVPVGILALTRLGAVSLKQLRQNRRYAFLACAVIAMVLPGTDPITFFFILVPLVALYELSILMTAIFVRPREGDDVDEDDDVERDDDPDDDGPGGAVAMDDDPDDDPEDPDNDPYGHLVPDSDDEDGDQDIDLTKNHAV